MEFDANEYCSVSGKLERYIKRNMKPFPYQYKADPIYDMFYDYSIFQAKKRVHKRDYTDIEELTVLLKKAKNSAQKTKSPELILKNYKQNSFLNQVSENLTQLLCKIESSQPEDKTNYYTKHLSLFSVNTSSSKNLTNSLFGILSYADKNIYNYLPYILYCYVSNMGIIVLKSKRAKKPKSKRTKKNNGSSSDNDAVCNFEDLSFVLDQPCRDRFIEKLMTAQRRKNLLNNYSEKCYDYKKGNLSRQYFLNYWQDFYEQVILFCLCAEVCYTIPYFSEKFHIFSSMMLLFSQLYNKEKPITAKQAITIYSIFFLPITHMIPSSFEFKWHTPLALLSRNCALFLQNPSIFDEKDYINTHLFSFLNSDCTFDFTKITRSFIVSAYDDLVISESTTVEECIENYIGYLEDELPLNEGNIVKYIKYLIETDRENLQQSLNTFTVFNSKNTKKFLKNLYKIASEDSFNAFIDDDVAYCFLSKNNEEKTKDQKNRTRNFMDRQHKNRHHL